MTVAEFLEAHKDELSEGEIITTEGHIVSRWFTEEGGPMYEICTMHISGQKFYHVACGDQWFGTQADDKIEDLYEIFAL